jgi:hypothetical protein
VRLLVNEDVDFEQFKDSKGKSYSQILDNLEVLWKDEIHHIIKTKLQLKIKKEATEDNRAISTVHK